MESMEIFAAGKSRSVSITRKRIRRMHLRMGENGSLRISCPLRTPVSEIVRFIVSSEQWIRNAEIREVQKELRFADGSTGPVVYWFGEKKYCRYEEGRRDSVRIDGDMIVFTLKDMSAERITKVFRKYADAVILEKAEYYRAEWDQKICRTRGLPLPEIRTRYMTSRWGVCRISAARITLSTRLIHYPEEALQAILLHEYVHLLVPNHSKRFYDYVYYYMPAYERYRALLNERG